MVKQPSKWTVTFEFSDGFEKVYTDTVAFRGVRHNGQRPDYSIFNCMITEDEISESDLHRIRNTIFKGIASTLSPGYIRGRVILKPLWLHELINNRS